MKYFYFAQFEDGFANQFRVIPEEELTIYTTHNPTSVEITKEQFDDFSAYREGRIIYVDGGFVKLRDADDAEVMTKKVLGMRQFLLADSDWVVLRAQEQGTEVPEEWKIYRQALRDIPEQAGFPLNVTWPNKPI